MMVLIMHGLCACSKENGFYRAISSFLAEWVPLYNYRGGGSSSSTPRSVFKLKQSRWFSDAEDVRSPV